MPKKSHSSATSASLMKRTVKLLRHDAYNCIITSPWRVQLYNYGWNQACWWPIRFENFDIVMITDIIVPKRFSFSSCNLGSRYRNANMKCWSKQCNRLNIFQCLEFWLVLLRLSDEWKRAILSLLHRSCSIFLAVKEYCYKSRVWPKITLSLYINNNFNYVVHVQNNSGRHTFEASRNNVWQFFFYHLQYFLVLCFFLRFGSSMPRFWCSRDSPFLWRPLATKSLLDLANKFLYWKQRWSTWRPPFWSCSQWKIEDHQYLPHFMWQVVYTSNFLWITVFICHIKVNTLAFQQMYLSHENWPISLVYTSK